jgi:hypothetical protein
MRQTIILAGIAVAVMVLASAESARAETPYATAWTRQLGTTSYDGSRAVAVGTAGNAYISGYTQGNLGGTNAGGYDAFLTKYNSSGTAIWTRQIGTSGYDYSYGVAVDTTGNAYISGYTQGGLGGTNAGGYDAFLTKYDSSGAVQWSRQVGSGSDDYGYGVAVDTTGNTYMTGYTRGTLTGTSAGGYDAFLVKYNSSGAMLWSRQFGTNKDEISRSVAVDAAGNAYLTGYTAGNLGGTSAGTADVFLTKYDSSGTPLWSRQFGSSGWDDGLGVALDPAGNIYLSGVTTGNLSGTNAGGYDAFMAKCDSSGTVLWSRQIGTGTNDYSMGVAVDAAGNAFMSGYTADSLGGPQAGSNDAFLTKYDTSGSLLWSRQIGTSADEYGNGVAVDPAGNAYITGATYGGLDGPSAGNADAFLVQFAAPEPATLGLLAMGAVAGLVWRRRRSAS